MYHSIFLLIYVYIYIQILRMKVRVYQFLTPSSPLVISSSKQQAQYLKAEEDATRAILWDPTYSKAHYRRSLARTALGNFEQAMEDLTKVKELLPGDPQIDREIRDLRNMQSKKQEQDALAERQAPPTQDSEKKPRDSPSFENVGNVNNQGTQSKRDGAHDCNRSSTVQEGRGFRL